MFEGLLTDGEPVLKRPKVKVRAANKDAYIGMPLSIWLNLILKPRLSLVELIKMKRLCRTFYAYADLKALIALKQHSAFDGISERHWNHMAAMVKSPPMADDTWYEFRNPLVAEEFFEDHKGKFILLQHFPAKTIKNGRFMLGVFSSRNRLLVAAANVVDMEDARFYDVEYDSRYCYLEKRPLIGDPKSDYYLYVPECIASALIDYATEMGKL